MANVPSAVVQETLNNVLSCMFQDSVVQCEKHEVGNDLVIVMIANGVCATLSIQEMYNKKGVAI